MTASRTEAKYTEAEYIAYIKNKSGELTKLLQAVRDQKKTDSTANEAVTKLTNFLTTSDNLATILKYREPSGNGPNDFQIMCSLLMNVAPEELNIILMKYLTENELACLFMESCIDTSILLSLIYLCGIPFFDKISAFLLKLENQPARSLVIHYHFLLNLNHEKKKTSDDDNACPVLPEKSYACLLNACSATQLYKILRNLNEDFPLFWEYSSDETKNQVIAKLVSLTVSVSENAYILLLELILEKLNKKITNANSILKISADMINEKIAKFYFARFEKEGEQTDKEKAIAIWRRFPAENYGNNLFLANTLLDEVEAFEKATEAYEKEEKSFREKAAAFAEEKNAFRKKTTPSREETKVFEKKATTFAEQTKIFKEKEAKRNTNTSPLYLHYLACKHLYYAYRKEPDNLPLTILTDINVGKNNNAYERNRLLFLSLTYLHIIYLKIIEFKKYNASLENTLPEFFALLGIMKCFINKTETLLLPQNGALKIIDIKNSQIQQTAHTAQKEIRQLEKKEDFDTIALLSPPLNVISCHTYNCSNMLYTFFGSSSLPLLNQADLLNKHLRYLSSLCHEKSSQPEKTSQPITFISQRKT